MKRFFKVFSLNPSIYFLPGGSIQYVFILLSLTGQFKYSKKSIFSLLIGLSLLILFIKKFEGIPQVFAYLIGPLFMFSFMKVDFSTMKKPIVLFLILLFADALIGFLLNYSNERSLTFISNEPSHSARFFFALVFVCHLINSTNATKLRLASIFYLILNSSFTGFLFFLAYIAYSTKRIFNFRKITYLILSLISFTLILSAAFPSLRITKQINVIRELDVNNLSLDNLAIITQIGSRRLTQSILGFGISKPFEGVGVGESTDNFINDAINYTPDIKNIDNIYNRENVIPNSYLAQMCYEIGYINCLVFLLIILAPIIRHLGQCNWYLFVFGLGQLLILSTSTFITPWLFIALSVNEFFNHKKNNQKVLHHQ